MKGATSRRRRDEPRERRLEEHSITHTQRQERYHGVRETSEKEEQSEGNYCLAKLHTGRTQ